MNRRELIASMLTLPIIPYIGTKYKTPETDRVVYKLINNTWVEYPFDELQKDDVIRIANGINRIPDDTLFTVNSIIPGNGKECPNGITVSILQV